ncbi:MAG: septum formation initiator family protein [Tyzzerella sp.]|nr:septum formation initiator family protein [Tyzzerella sp.]
MKKVKKRNTHVRRRILEHRLSILLIICVIVVLGVTLSVASISLHKKNQGYKAQETELQKQLEEEKARAEEIDELEKYVGTDEYIEDVAKDKLGLVYPNEILFKAE